MPESETRENSLERVLSESFYCLGIHPRWIEVLGDRVHVSDGKVVIRTSIGTLSDGLSVVMKDEGKRLLVKAGGNFTCQIHQIVRVGKREGNK